MALEKLAATREQGFRRGLVVLATGLGKTWLAAFDVAQVGARRVLFVAHREEILQQAAETFVRLRPGIRVGLYTGKSRDAEVDVFCASVQTLARSAHLERFEPQHFDYMREVIRHAQLGIDIHLFVRENKLLGGKGRRSSITAGCSTSPIRGASP